MVFQLVIISLMILQPLINLFCLCPTFRSALSFRHFANPLRGGLDLDARPLPAANKMVKTKPLTPKVLTIGFSRFDNVQISPLATCGKDVI